MINVFTVTFDLFDAVFLCKSIILKRPLYNSANIEQEIILYYIIYDIIYIIYNIIL